MERTFHMLLYRTFHAQRNALRPHLGELGLGAGQPKVLGYLVRNGASRQRQLAEYCEIDPAAISRMLDSLQRGGFVELQPGKGNRRCEEIVVTDRGRRPMRCGRATAGRWRSRCWPDFPRRSGPGLPTTWAGPTAT